MGGNGSGRYGFGSARTVVEDCNELDINWMVRGGLFDCASRRHGYILFDKHSRRKLHTAYQIEKSGRMLFLNYTFEKEQILFSIRLETTPLPWGGSRWWMRCPLIVGGVPCRRRVAKLWRPEYSKYFGCRHCLDLTYYSSQRSSITLRCPTTFDQRFFRDFIEQQAMSYEISRHHERLKQRRRRRKEKGWQ